MRPDRFHEEDTNDDSFLDVIANVVGVLIILVMLVGVKASHRMIAAKSDPAVTVQQTNPATLETQPAVQESQPAEIKSSISEADLVRLREQLDEARRHAIASQREIQEMAVRVININQESAAHDQRRIQLAMHRSVLEKDLEKRRSKLDSHRQQEFDVQRQLVEAQIDLDEMTKEQLTLAMERPTVEEVECVPTPLAKTIEGEAIHLRMHKGLVSIVPLEELLREVQNHVDDFRRRLQSRDEVVETFGPMGGYRLRFTITKRSEPGSIGGPRAGQLQRVTHDQYAQVLPVADKLGQKVEQALLPGSDLHKRLHSNRRQSPPVVVWLYTDSFNEYRPLKRALWEMGIAVAVRPMRPGSHIGASPHGSKSSAQ